MSRAPPLTDVGGEVFIDSAARRKAGKYGGMFVEGMSRRNLSNKVCRGLHGKAQRLFPVDHQRITRVGCLSLHS